jgi:hypothetical protein
VYQERLIHGRSFQSLVIRCWHCLLLLRRYILISHATLSTREAIQLQRPLASRPSSCYTQTKQPSLRCPHQNQPSLSPKLKRKPITNPDHYSEKTRKSLYRSGKPINKRNSRNGRKHRSCHQVLRDTFTILTQIHRYKNTNSTSVFTDFYKPKGGKNKAFWIWWL